MTPTMAPSWAKLRERLPEEQADFPDTREYCDVLVTDGSQRHGLVPGTSWPETSSSSAATTTLTHALNPAQQPERLYDTGQVGGDPTATSIAYR